MMFALGAATSAIDSLFGLVSPKQTQSAGSSQDQTNLFAFQADAATSIGPGVAPAGGGGAQISPETMSALLTAQGGAGLDASSAMRSGSLKEWFAKVDSDGDGKISKSEFEALGRGQNAQSDDAFGKLDTDGDGSISPAELLAALKGKGHQRHHQQQVNGSEDPQSDPLMQALDGSLSTSAANAGASSTAASSYSFIDQLIPRRPETAAQITPSLSVSV